MKTSEDADSHSESNRMNALIPYGIESKFLNITSNFTNDFKNSGSDKGHVLVLDGIITSRLPYLSLYKKQLKLVGLSPLPPPDKTKEFEHILECCAFTFVDENVIYNAENKIN